MDSCKLLWSLLKPEARKQLWMLLVLTTLSGFVEILSVGLVIPFIAVASGSLPYGRASRATRALTDFTAYLGVPPNRATAALGCIFLLGVCLANTYLCFYQYYAAWVVQTQKRDFSVRILKVLSHKPLEWLDQENTADLGKAALTDVSYVAELSNSIVQVIAILTRCAVVYLFFLYTQMRLALALAGLLLVAYSLVFRYLRKPMSDAGVSAEQSYANMFRAANELMGGTREVRTSGTEDHFLSRFSTAADQSIKPQIIKVMPSYLTRAALESVTVAVVIILLIYFNAKDGSLANGLPLLSSYAVAGIRLLPALQQSLSFYLQIKFYSPSLAQVARILQVAPDREERLEPSTSDLHLEREVRLCDIEYGYQPDSLILKGISLNIRKNSRVAFVGETGAGKSTLVDIILGLRWAQSGKILVDHREITPSSVRAWRKNVGYVPQSIYLLDSSIAENIAFGVEPTDIDPTRLASACKAASIDTFIENLPNGYQTEVGERGVRLSGGQCQRIGIARALYQNPEVVVFDEATSALDSMTESQVLEALDRLKGVKTLLVIAHRLNTVWDFDEIFVLDQGQLVGRGTSRELLETCPTFAKIASHQVNLVNEPSAPKA